MAVLQPPSVNPTLNYHMMIMEKQMVLAEGIQPQDKVPGDHFNMKEFKKNATPKEIQDFKNQRKEGKTAEQI